MPPESIDDNLEHVHAEWMKRLRAREINQEEARAVLHVMKGRLEFLRNLHSRIGHVEQEIERQVEEIETVQRFIDEG
jgi:hypothetical protein